jgi:hypothetical protein
MDTRLTINSIKLHEDSKSALLALGCDLKFHEWGRPCSDIAKRGEPCYEVFFPPGSQKLKHPQEPKIDGRAKHVEIRGWMLVPTDLVESGRVIVVWRPADTTIEKPGGIISIRAATQTCTSRCGYKLGRYINGLEFRPALGKELS